METITGTVQRVLWSSPEEGNHYKVFKLRRKGNQYDTVTGEFEELIEGAEVEIHGDYHDHPKYGRGFRAKAYVFTFDKSSVYSISLYMQSIAKFIGPVRAQAIAAKFGSDLEDIIEKNWERLLEVEDVGRKTAENLVAAWREHREEKNVRIFLHSLGLSARNIKRILTAFGVDTEVKIRENPYLLTLVGFGFSTCDYIASKLGMDPGNPLRFKYFIVWALRESMSNGHLFLYEHQIIKIFNNYNERTNYHFKSGEIEKEDVTSPIQELIEEGYIVEDKGRYYELESFFFENESARLLSLTKSHDDMCVGFKDLDVNAFITEFEKRERQNTGIEDFSLSDDQKDAIRSFVKEKILIITGGPGTGKTETQKAIVQLMIEHHVSFELLAPTGIAAKRLGNASQYEAYTIHRRLGYQGSDWGYDAHQKYNTDVIIVDEMSMVDMEVFYHLVAAMYTHTKFVFVGDNDQLPSVGPGRVLNELIHSGQFKTIFLKNIFRQAAQSDIIKQARKIREGDLDLELLSPQSRDDIWFLRSSSTAWIEEKIVEFSRDLKTKIKEQGGNKTFQIITPRNSGPLSVETLNIALQSALNPRIEGEREVQLNTCVLRKGDRVLIKKNNYTLDVYNGDIGKVTGLVKADIMVEIDDYEGKRQVAVPMEQAEEMLKLGYALTIHKAQGSEYDLVLLPIVKSHGKRILQRNLLYTAITRAKKKVIMFGQGAAVVDAIENDKIQERNTLLAERIKAWIKDEGISLQQLYTNVADYQNAGALKRLLLSEEKASSQLATADTWPAENPDSNETTNIASKQAPPKKPSPVTSLESVLGEVEKLIEDTEDSTPELEKPLKKPKKSLRKKKKPVQSPSS